MKAFSSTSTPAHRAVQAWQLLFVCALNRSTISYNSLSRLMYDLDEAPALVPVLTQIYCCCHINGLPRLDSLVTGVPNRPDNIPETLEVIYALQWHHIEIPTVEDIEEACEIVIDVTKTELQHTKWAEDV